MSVKRVLAAYDDNGHMTAFDVSTIEQELKILEGMCKEAAKAGRLDDEEKQSVKKALADKDVDALYELLEDADLLHTGRNSANVVAVQDTWETGLGILNL